MQDMKTGVSGIETSFMAMNSVMICKRQNDFIRCSKNDLNSWQGDSPMTYRTIIPECRLR